MTRQGAPWRRAILACYAHFLVLYPPNFRTRYARELRLCMRDYAREHSLPAVLLFLFSDLLISVPREYVKEVNVQLNNRSLAAVAGGVFLLAMAVLMVVQDMRNPYDRMGFFAVLVTCTIALAGGALVLFAGRPSARYLWLVPAAYAAAAGTWLLLTPVAVPQSPSPLLRFLFRLGQPAAIALLFVPAALALLPIVVRARKHAENIATLLVIILAVLTTALLGAYYLPAAIAMALVRFATSPRTWFDTRSIGPAGLALILCAGLAQPAHAQQKPAAARMSAAADLLKAMNIGDDYFASGQEFGNEMFGQMPNAAEMRGVMKEFMAKHLPPSKLRGEMTRLYAEAFTIQELRELTAFYRTPLGQKTARAQPRIAADFARFSQAELMKHMPELQQLMMQKMMKQ